MAQEQFGFVEEKFGFEEESPDGRFSSVMEEVTAPEPQTLVPEEQYPEAFQPTTPGTRAREMALGAAESLGMDITSDYPGLEYPIDLAKGLFGLAQQGYKAVTKPSEGMPELLETGKGIIEGATAGPRDISEGYNLLQEGHFDQGWDTIARGVGELVGTGIDIVGGEKVLAQVPGLRTARRPVQATRADVGALASMVPSSKTHGAPSPVHVAEMSQPLYQQAVQELVESGADINPGQLFPTRETAVATDVVGNVPRGGTTEAAAGVARAQGVPEIASVQLEVARRMVDIADRPFDMAMEIYGHNAVPEGMLDNLVSDLRLQADATVDPQLRRAIQQRADSLETTPPANISDLNDIKIHANKEMRPPSAIPGQQIAADAQTSFANKVLGDTIRKFMYPEIERLGGPNLRGYGARAGAAIATRDGIFGNYAKSLGKQAQEMGVDYWVHLGEGSPYNRNIVLRALEPLTTYPVVGPAISRVLPTPAARFNRAMNRAVGDIGEGMVPERINVEGTFNEPQPLLPPPPGSTPNVPPVVGSALRERLGPNYIGGRPREQMFQFSMEGGPAVESVVGEMGEKAGREYLGSRDVPNPDFEPMSGGSRTVQREQLGALESTIPESIFGRSSSRVRADELPSGSARATPERSFTGPETLSESNWQFLGETSGPGRTSTVSGPGRMSTTDPRVALSTVQAITREIASNPNMPASRLRTLQDARNSLIDQLEAYRSYQGRTAPSGIGSSMTVNPMQPGTRPVAPRRMQMLRAGAGGSVPLIPPPPGQGQ